MQTPADRIQFVQGESERFKRYIHALPVDAWSRPSACDGWEVQGDPEAATRCGQWFQGI